MKDKIKPRPRPLRDASRPEPEVVHIRRMPRTGATIGDRDAAPRATDIDTRIKA